MTDQQLIDFSGEHLMRKLTMPWEMAAMLPGRKASTETSASVESSSIHLRSLIDFFYRPRNGDDVTALDFLNGGIHWKPAEPQLFTDAHARAYKELNHLTQFRKSGSPKDKDWDTAKLLEAIDTVARDFVVKASPKKLADAFAPRVRQLSIAPRIASGQCRCVRTCIFSGDNPTELVEGG